MVVVAKFGPWLCTNSWNAMSPCQFLETSTEPRNPKPSFLQGPFRFHIELTRLTRVNLPKQIPKSWGLPRSGCNIGKDSASMGKHLHLCKYLVRTSFRLPLTLADALCTPTRRCYNYLSRQGLGPARMETRNPECCTRNRTNARHPCSRRDNALYATHNKKTCLDLFSVGPQIA